MITTEYVMAVLCQPLSFRELLNTEKHNNVVILRRIDYDSNVSYFTRDTYMPNLAVSPVKLMFVFGNGDAIVVSSMEDVQEVQRRLSIGNQQRALA